MPMFVSLGNADDHLTALREMARQHKSDEWTVLSDARPGDVVLIYFIAPTQAIVAHAVVESKAEKDQSGDWKGKYLAKIGNVKMLNGKQWALKSLRKSFPRWGWLTTPRGATHVPKDVAFQLAPSIKSTSSGRSNSPRQQGSRVSGIDTATPDPDYTPRVDSVVSRIVRETATSAELKKLYGWKCQVCSDRIVVPSLAGSRYYVEVHHLRPLGTPHDGRDNICNMLVLCPNCHVRFDLLGLAIKPGTNRVVENGPKIRDVASIRFIRDHVLDDCNVEYHWKRFERMG